MRYRMTATGTEKVDDDGSVIPIVADTDEYAAFYQWMLDGNQPEPPEPPTAPAKPTREDQVAEALAKLQALTVQIAALQAA
ncbi:hypothetical protein [Burkholderia vietnamiensis]|uniref:hypothetical protein n=1 Tax=Burkholderia vietnamiensis TaxID=60552 RepID=UPI000A4EBBAB|nr:hypothetical protein [Burkholderia vietnamiensis]